MGELEGVVRHGPSGRPPFFISLLNSMLYELVLIHSLQHDDTFSLHFLPLRHARTSHTCYNPSFHRYLSLLQTLSVYARG